MNEFRMLAPIVLFTYNRLAHTKKLIESLKKNGLAIESDLYIYSDAAKNKEVEGSVKIVREYIDEIDGFNNVKIIKRDINFGLAASIIDGVTEVINKHDRAIILEDDLVVSKYFLWFMNQALYQYENNNKIVSITGYSFDINFENKYQYDVYAFYRCMSWGWGTWKDRWNTVDWDIADKDTFIKDLEVQKKFNMGGEDLTDMLLSQLNHKIDSWAIRWCYHHSKNSGLCLYPVKSYVANNGFDGSGVHCKILHSSTQVQLNNEEINLMFDGEVNKDISNQILNMHRRKNIILRIINKIARLIL